MATVRGNNRNNRLRGTNRRDTLLGLGGNDIIDALAGNDLLDGGTGSDTMRGNGGNDVYVVDNEGDRVVERGGQGIDTVQASVSVVVSEAKNRGGFETLGAITTSVER